VQQEIEAKVAELDALQQWLQALEGMAESVFLLILFTIVQTKAVGSVEVLCFVRACMLAHDAAA
jgi:hypothetical protein